MQPYGEFSKPIAWDQISWFRERHPEIVDPYIILGGEEESRSERIMLHGELQQNVREQLKTTLYYAHVPDAGDSDRHTLPLSAFLKTYPEAADCIEKLVMMGAPSRTESGRVFVARINEATTYDILSVARRVRMFLLMGFMWEPSPSFTRPPPLNVALESLQLEWIVCKGRSTWTDILHCIRKWAVIHLDNVHHMRPSVAMPPPPIDTLKVLANSRDTYHGVSARSLPNNEAWSVHNLTKLVYTADCESDLQAVTRLVKNSSTTLQDLQLGFLTLESQLERHQEGLRHAVKKCKTLNFLELMMTLDVQDHDGRPRGHAVSALANQWILTVSESALTSMSIVLSVDDGSHSRANAHLASIGVERWTEILNTLQRMRWFRMLWIDVEGAGEDGKPYVWTEDHMIALAQAIELAGTETNKWTIRKETEHSAQTGTGYAAELCIWKVTLPGTESTVVASARTD